MLESIQHLRLVLHTSVKYLTGGFYSERTEWTASCDLYSVLFCNLARLERKTQLFITHCCNMQEASPSGYLSLFHSLCLYLFLSTLLFLPLV